MHAEFEIAGPAACSAMKVEISELVVAGWAGRDRAAVDHHIQELAELGVAPPKSVPLYYRVGENNLTQSAQIQVLGEASSGEVECFLLRPAAASMSPLPRITRIGSWRHSAWRNPSRSAPSR